MGYSVSGTAQVVVDELASASIILCLDELDNIASDNLTGDLFDRIMECWSDSGSVTQKDDHTTILELWMSDSWREHHEALLEWLVDKGCIVSGEFAGEDDAAWEYSTLNHQLVEHGLVRVRDTQFATMLTLQNWVKINGIEGLPPDLATILKQIES